jgi:perosamine synthetase
MTTTLVSKVVDAVLSVTGGPVESHPPWIEEDDYLAVAGQLMDLADYGCVTEFEGLLAQKCGRCYCVATSCGTAALEVALAAIGVGPGDGVAVPAISFVAAANAVAHRGARPVFVDVESAGFGMDPVKLDDLLAGQNIRAIIAVHVLGHPCRMQDISDVAFRHGVPLVEDAAEALGSKVYIEVGGNEFPEEHPCGRFGWVSVLSFNLNKIVTTGGGGAVLTDDEWLAERVRHLVTTARVKDPPWEVSHDAIAWNHRISMLAAALGYAQVQRLESLVAAKRALARAYEKAFASIPNVLFHDEPEGTVSNFWLPSIVVPEEQRTPLLTALNAAGIGARALFTPIDQLKPHQRKPHCPMADAGYRRTVCLPGGIELAKRFA